MILVDTSVLIDFFRGNDSPPVDRLEEILTYRIPFGISSVIYQEVLQGAKSEKEYNLLKEYLSTQRFFHPADPVGSYEQAARIYFTCSNKGITIRSTIDCLIARIALEQNLVVLHNDRDFDAMAPVIGLRVYV